jgi:hypothetical protein
MTTPDDEWGETEVVIPARCPRHPQLTTVLVRKLSDGDIELRCHTRSGCALTLPAASLFDVLGGWLA